MKTLEQFRQWAVKTKSVSNPTSVKSSKYKGECVSLIQQYIKQVFGIPYAPRGHAKDYVPPTFKRVSVNSKLKPGDVVRYPSSFGGGYGHIEMIDDDGKALAQNRNYSHKVSRTNSVRRGYTAVFRPTKNFKIKNTKKSNSQIATEVLDGKWGNGDYRKRKLNAAGYDYNAIQKIVNSRLNPKRKSNTQVAKEVVAGKWGNGAKRRAKLLAKGYNYRKVQRIVNRLMR